MMEPEYLRPRDVSIQVNVTTRHIYNMVARGEIPSVDIGKSLSIPRLAWETWLKEQNEQAKAGTAR